MAQKKSYKQRCNKVESRRSLTALRPVCLSGGWLMGFWGEHGKGESPVMPWQCLLETIILFILNNPIDDHREEAQLQPELTQGAAIGEKINTTQLIMINSRECSFPSLHTDAVPKVLYLLYTQRNYTRKCCFKHFLSLHSMWAYSRSSLSHTHTHTNSGPKSSLEMFIAVQDSAQRPFFSARRSKPSKKRWETGLLTAWNCLNSSD